MADGNFGFEVNGFDSYTLLLGEELRGERATLGKSLLQVQKDLKIKAAYISAIENCDLDAFPNKGFVAGYVRSYARYLNLNPEEVYERFCVESGFSSHDSSRKIARAGVSKKKVLKDYNIERQLDWKPSYVGFQEADSNALSRGYLYFTPFLIAFCIVFGICFGAWKILIDIQKLKIVPADNLPIIMSEMNLDPSDIINENKVDNYKFAVSNFKSIGHEVSNSSKLRAPQVSYRDGPIASLELEDIGVLGMNSTKIDKSLPILSASALNMKQVTRNNLDYGIVAEFSLLTSAEFNEDLNKTTELAISKTTETLTSLPIQNSQNVNLGNESSNKKIILSGKKPETTLNIFAVNPSWIRIKDKGKRVVVEKILKAGEVLKIKNKWFNGNLRAGNAKDLFFSLNGVTYGPVSDKRKVIKNFRIDPQNIFNSLKINELEDSYLNSFLNKKRSL